MSYFSFFRKLPAAVAKFQTTEKHRVFYIPNILAFHTHCDVIMGVILDKP